MKRSMAVYLLGTFILSLLFSFCSRPKEVLSRKEMEKLMYDVYIAEAMIDNDYSGFNTPEKKEALINEVFKKHRTTQAQWDSSLSWYSDRVEIYLKMNDSVKSRLQRRQQASEQVMNRQFAQEQLLSFRSLSSYIPVTYSFYELNPKNGFRFRLDTAEISRRITHPDFDFTFETWGISPDRKPNLEAMLLLEYADTAIYRSETISENRKYVLNGQRYLVGDSTRPGDTLRTITGFVKLQDKHALFRNIHLNKITLGNTGDSLRMQPGDSLMMQQPLQKLSNEPLTPRAVRMENQLSPVTRAVTRDKALPSSRHAEPLDKKTP